MEPNSIILSTESVSLLAKSIAIISMFGSAIGEGYAAGKAMEAIGRNPEAADIIFPKLIVAMAITESTAIYALVAFFLL